MELKTSIKTTDESEIKYYDITAGYKRWFKRPWNLNEIVDKYEKILSGLKDISKDYGREYAVDPIEFTIRANGTSAKVHSPEKVRLLLPNRSKQRKGIDEVSCKFRTIDDKISGIINYERWRSFIVHCGTEGGAAWHEPFLWTVLEISGFTEKNKEEYDRMRNFLKKNSYSPSP